MSYEEALARLKKLYTVPADPPAEPAAKRAPGESVLQLVRCGDCQHFRPDRINPAQGLGACKIGADGKPPGTPGKRLPWPNLLRHCSSFNSKYSSTRGHTHDRENTN